MVVQVVRRQIWGCIFKVDLVGFVDGLDAEWEKKMRTEDLGLNNWKVRITMN